MKEQAATNHTPDHGNRLTKIDNPSGDDYVYEYDGDGMRVRSGHDSGQGNVWNTRFYYDVVPSVYAYLFESDDAKNMTVAYTIDRSGSLISQRRGGSTYYHHYDALGSTRLLTDSSQTITDTYDYYAFGEIQSSSASTTNPFKFVGRLGYYDDPTTPFQYLRARYYAPAYGRLLSVDPALRGRVGREGLPYVPCKGWARGEEVARDWGYSYCGSCAVSRVDPSGRWSIFNWPWHCYHCFHPPKELQDVIDKCRIIAQPTDNPWDVPDELKGCGIDCEKWSVMSLAGRRLKCVECLAPDKDMLKEWLRHCARCWVDNPL
jgi:RHS repeat-associated protein